jgi:hypothetical protein
MKFGWRPDRFVILVASGAAVLLAATGSGAADLLLTPGLYQVEVRIGAPNVQDAALPQVLTRCIRPDDLKSGQAFFVLSDNPLKRCQLVDYQATADAALYRIVCAGQNRGSAVGVFDTKGTSYRGTIRMSPDGKNMTRSETQAGKRIGNCS